MEGPLSGFSLLTDTWDVRSGQRPFVHCIITHGRSDMTIAATANLVKVSLNVSRIHIPELSVGSSRTTSMRIKEFSVDLSHRTRYRRFLFVVYEISLSRDAVYGKVRCCFLKSWLVIQFLLNFYEKCFSLFNDETVVTLKMTSMTLTIVYRRN